LPSELRLLYTGVDDRWGFDAGQHLSIIFRRREPKALVLLLALVLACLLPFLNKPVHMDDPLFIWSARQICAHPADFYGGPPINWYGSPMRFSDVPKNPPLASLLSRGSGGDLRMNERALHAAMLLPALLAVWGVYELARRLCSRPAIAVAIAVLSPAFIVSATTLMCDVLMLCLFVWRSSRGLTACEREASEASFYRPS